MNLRSYILIICCIFVTACTSSPHFPKEETIKQEVFQLKGITNPCRLEVKSPYLIVQNNHEQRLDSIFHVYSLKSNELTSVFGLIGRGPDEFVYPSLFATQLPDIRIQDMQNEFLTSIFEIDSDGIPLLKETRMPEYMLGVLNAAFINDSIYVNDDSFLAPNLSILSFSDEEPKKSWQYGDPAIINRFADPDRGNVYANGSRIVFCRYYKKEIFFMDTDLNIVKKVEFEELVSAITEQTQSDAKVCYSSAYLGKQYFYALYRGISYNESKNTPDNPTTLEVFDMDGNPVIQYHFEGLSPDFFVVDEETFTLYGGRYDGEPIDHLLMYRLTLLTKLN